MTPQQREVVDEVYSSVVNGTPMGFFLGAPAGKGKTYVENLLLGMVRCDVSPHFLVSLPALSKLTQVQGEIALAAASSGIAAILLDLGRTAHSTWKIPLDISATA